MSVRTIRQYQYQAPATLQRPPHFELKAIDVDTYCVANENEQSDYYKIFWIEDGYGEYQIDFKSFKIEKSGLFFLSPGQILTIESEKVKSGYQISFDREFYCVETHGKEIACNGVLFNNVHRATMIPLVKEDNPYFLDVLQNMMKEIESPGPAHREMLETYLRMFLIGALRKWESLNLKPEVKEDEQSRLAADFIALVEKHFTHFHSVTAYAEKLGVSPKSISKRLNILGYKKPTEIIRDRIVLQAKRELRFSNKSVKEIAFELGFDDPAYFTRYFKKGVGESPLSYREKNS